MRRTKVFAWVGLLAVVAAVVVTVIGYGGTWAARGLWILAILAFAGYAIIGWRRHRDA